MNNNIFFNTKLEKPRWNPTYKFFNIINLSKPGLKIIVQFHKDLFKNIQKDFNAIYGELIYAKSWYKNTEINNYTILPSTKHNRITGFFISNSNNIEIEKPIRFHKVGKTSIIICAFNQIIKEDGITYQLAPWGFIKID